MSLLYRCAHLANTSRPQRLRLLLVTFTVAAKEELAARIAEDPALERIRDNVEITTLNSWGFRRLKSLAFNPTLVTKREGYHFTMLNLLQPVWVKHDPVRKAIERYKHTAPKQLFSIIDGFKSLGFDHTRHVHLEQFAARVAELRGEGLRPRLEQLYDELTKFGILGTILDESGREKPSAGARDVYERFFGFWREASSHLIASATFTLEDQKYVAFLDEREKLDDGRLLTGAARYDHVLVDEFQDINPLDLALVKAIADRSRARITVLGDDDQAIFEWRGATPEYILDPSRFFGREFSTFHLSINYRSARNVVRLSQRLISNNTRRVPKAVEAHRTDDAEIRCLLVQGLGASMDLVLEEVKRAISGGTSPARIAIIGRKRNQLIPFQIFFASNGIPFCAAEDLQLFLSQAFERLLSLLVLKERATQRQPRTQLAKDIVELCNLVKRYPLSKPDAAAVRSYVTANSAGTLLEAADALAAYRGQLKGANPDGRVSQSMADALGAYLRARSVSQALLELNSRFMGLQIDMGKAEDDIFYVDPPFLHLAEYAVRYGSDYLQFVDDLEQAKEELARVPPFIDDADPATRSELWKRPVHLMTALRAKGKEFDTVVLLGVNDEIWPSKQAVTPAEREAERRVFYVAFTRARKRVLALVDQHYGRHAVCPSPYIQELGLEAERASYP